MQNSSLGRFERHVMKSKLLVVALIVLPLSGCGIFGGKDKAAAARPPADLDRPATKDLIRGLPEGLVGDKENARYTNEELKGDGGRP